MAVYLIGNLNINQETTAATSVQNIINSVHFQNVTLITTGVPELLKTINDYLKHGILVLAGIAAIVMVTILALSFTVRWRLLAFAIVAIGMVWGFGLVGYFGVPLTLATITALPVLLGVGMDYAIQMHSCIEEEVVLDRAAAPHPGRRPGARPRSAGGHLRRRVRLHRPVVRRHPGHPSVRIAARHRHRGGVRVQHHRHVGRARHPGVQVPHQGQGLQPGPTQPCGGVLGEPAAKAAIPLALASVVIFLGGVAVEGKLVLQTDPIQWINPQAQSTKNLEALKAGTGSDNELAANVTSNHPFSDQTVNYVATFSVRCCRPNTPTSCGPGRGS